MILMCFRNQGELFLKSTYSSAQKNKVGNAKYWLSSWLILYKLWFALYLNSFLLHIVNMFIPAVKLGILTWKHKNIHSNTKTFIGLKSYRSFYYSFCSFRFYHTQVQSYGNVISHIITQWPVCWLMSCYLTFIQQQFDESSSLLTAIYRDHSYHL